MNHLTDVKSTLVQVMACLGVIRQQAITSANVDPDLCHHMASLGLNELTHYGSKMENDIIDFC